MADRLHLEGRSKKRLLVDRLETACRRAEMHLPHGKYVMKKHDTERRRTVRHDSVQTTSNYSSISSIMHLTMLILISPLNT